MNPQFNELKKRLGEIHDLNKIGWVLSWDQQTMMAKRGGPVRAEQIATLNKIALERFTAPEMGRLLDDLQAYGESLPYDSDEASLIRVARHDYEKARRVPAELQAERVRASSLARQAWVEARQKSDFSLFLPHLQKNVDLTLKYVECMADGEEQAYDVLLDDYEQGLKTAEVARVFSELKTGLVPLIAAIRAKEDSVSDACLHQAYAADQQTAFCWQLIEQLGAKRESWRLDPTVHPFASNSATHDIRITTRYYADFLNPALFGSMHEFGHGLYEHQVSPALERTPLCRGASLSLHESQSRMWENLVGRSRAFWRFMYPKLQGAFPAQLGGVDLEVFYRAINKVQPSFIRVEADEATYSLHIILRFELEQEMVNGQLALRDLPEAWNSRFEQFFGIQVPNDADGVLQDIHWSGGMIGYFPTYSLGSILASQLWEKIMAEVADLPAQFERGEFAALRTWLRENLHQHGRKFTPAETLHRIVGRGIDVQPYLRYLNSKYGEIYELN